MKTILKQPASEAKTMSQESSQYAAKWETWTLIPAGAGWSFAVGIIEQDGRRRVRVAKGKFKVASAGELPITQQAKFNLKPADWKPLRAAIDQYIAELEAEQKESDQESKGD
jgi:hypothetical protein